MTSTATAQTATNTGLDVINDQLVFVHGTGGIGSTGSVAVDVQIAGPISSMTLPDPASVDATATWVRALSVVDDLDDPTAYIAAVGAIAIQATRAPDAAAHAALAIVGDPGAGKTEIATLAFSHYGASFGGASMNGTNGAYRRAAVGASGAAILLDDAHAQRNSRAAKCVADEIEHALRVSYEGASAAVSRVRMGTDAEGRFVAVRDTESPIAPLVVITAEPSILGGLNLSVARRLLSVRVERGAFISGESHQHARAVAADGTLAAAFALYAQDAVGCIEADAALRAGEYEFDLLERAADSVARPLMDAHDLGDARAAEVALRFATGWTMYVVAAQRAGAINAARANELIEMGVNLLAVAAAKHLAATSPVTPTESLITTVRQALTAGRAYLHGDERDGHAVCIGKVTTLRTGVAVALFAGPVGELADLPSHQAVLAALRPVAILLDGSTHQVTRTMKIQGICIRVICVPREVLYGQA